MNKGKLKDVMVPVQAVIGETQLSVEKLSQLTNGSIVQLNSFAGEAIDILAAGQIVAKAEVVVIDESFGFRITEMVAKGGD